MTYRAHASKISRIFKANLKGKDTVLVDQMCKSADM